MQREKERQESEPAKFEEEKSIETPWVQSSRHKPNKAGQTIISNLIDGVRRRVAREDAALQDAERRHVGDTRYDINLYGGGTASIRDLCHVKKRKVR